MALKEAEINLPTTLVTLIDLGHVEREISDIENFVIQSSVREAGKQPKLPRISRSLEELAQLNKVNLLISEQRIKLNNSVKHLQQHAPLVHISFASEPSRSFTTKIINWFRQEINPQVFLQIGLQPSIAAGCTLRTLNKQFDLSLRRNFYNKRQLLIDKLTRESA